ncbi:MAG: hypothetical protein NC094_05790 [Bacteroidales bacterium]|nr:hypothetical protein [Lachnoclostridium sp.]MCM1384334.1 hypothetical protein [Lachnoclostridium sp.]MCM1464915.1 hypothetical protein [Bacteroidales bacterium]
MREKFWKCAVFLLLVVYLGMFAYLNLAKYTQHVDSDIAAEALLAREIWTEKTLTPDDWLGSTERYIFGMPAIAAVFYGITGSMTTAVGLACVFIGAVVAGGLYLFLRKLGLSVTPALAAVLALCAIPVNGIRNEGQMVPFVALLLFLFAGYYAIHSILMFLTVCFYLHLKKGKAGYREIIGWVLLWGFTLLIALGGQKCLQMVILPMIVVEAVSLFMESDAFARKLPRGRYYATGYVGTMILAYLVSSLYKGQADYPLFLLSPGEVAERIFITVPATVLEGFGIAGNARVGGLDSLMQMLVWAFLVLVGYGLFYIFRKKSEVPKKQQNALAIFLTSLGITAFIVAITTAEPAHNYFLFSWYVAIVTVGILIDCFQKKKAWFADLILLAICVFAVLNVKYTYADAVTTTDHLKDYEEVADFLIEEGISYGYGEFWDADRISMVRDGAVTMGHCYGMEDLKMYWWQTCKKWYPPNLPEEMPTAYVVKTAKKEAFEAQFTEKDSVALRFENERFAVYISNRNYVRME